VSIIYEALQKTQRQRSNTQNALPRLKAQHWKWLDLGLIVTIICLLGVIAVAYFPHIVRHAPKKLPVVVHPVAPPVLPKKVEYKPNLILNGVMLAEDDEIALINNKSFHVGDTVEGLRVVSIRPETVKLRDNSNHTVVLQVTS
jgi:hypothetical protein